MPKMRRPEAIPVAGGLPARMRNHDRPARVAKALITLAHRGPEYSTAVEPELAGLGSAELRAVVTLLFNELAIRPTLPDTKGTIQ